MITNGKELTLSSYKRFACVIRRCVICTIKKYVVHMKTLKQALNHG